jgi:hypothetical protein
MASSYVSGQLVWRFQGWRVAIVAVGKEQLVCRIHHGRRDEEFEWKVRKVAGHCSRQVVGTYQEAH